MPEKKFVFSGKVGKANDTEDFEMKPHITYPMEEGTALITFEEEDGEKTEPNLDLGEECRIIVEAQPVHLMMPSLVETRTSMCRRTVLLTGIPNVMDQETLQDMLEIHFQKNGNCGGEIEAFLYNPLGQHTLALFSNVSSEDTEE
ncbi:hypothetical protein XENOCAPTIV_014655 [Xenoophorus captivus]|uniref:NID domain-containing protein n=1 Tax=Xenoophorus captivus TaxID=1517983 RepID=A0ABV0QT92_9TELE